MAIKPTASSPQEKRIEPRSDPLGPTRPLSHLVPKAPPVPPNTPLVASPPLTATFKAAADKFKHPPST
jgi:hypothetical protein